MLIAGRGRLVVTTKGRPSRKAISTDDAGIITLRSGRLIGFDRQQKSLSNKPIAFHASVVFIEAAIFVAHGAEHNDRLGFGYEVDFGL
jgi:hypothetical protein